MLSNISRPIVDIILPIYKPTDPVYQTVDSVIAQTYTDWHLYIVDDASKDNSLEKIKDRYSIYPNKITYFQFDENKRAAACRNYAIKQGKGEYIAFIDQDDIWVKEKLQLQIEYVKKYRVDAVHGNFKYINNYCEIILKDKSELENESRRGVDWLNLRSIELAKKIFLKPNIRLISSMVSRNLFEKIGGFKGQFFGGEDELFWFEATLNGRIGFIDNYLFLRRNHSNNTSHVFKVDRQRGELKSLDYIKSNYFEMVKDQLHLRIKVRSYALLRDSIKGKRFFLSLITLTKLVIRYPVFTVEKLSQSILNKFRLPASQNKILS